MNDPLIVVAGFRREASILRLLTSLLRAQYPHKSVRICLSLDGGFSQEVLTACKEFKNNFEFGSVEIVEREDNIGLRNHIIWCGDQSQKAGSVIVLEDDLVVDPQFYLYAVKALSAYGKDKSVAGIALYSPEYNEYAGLPFKPLMTNYSGYFMKVACSWGQAWSAEQWSKFKSWYTCKNSEDVRSVDALPEPVKKWPESSWKKYFSAYIVENDLWFFYPYRSYTTNSSDPGGQHNTFGTNIFQTNLAFGFRSTDEFHFPESSSKNTIFYDSFMEPASSFIFDRFGSASSEIEIDLYGIKPLSLLKNKKKCVTTKSCKKYSDKFFLNMKPLENSLTILEKSMDGCPVYIVETAMLNAEGKGLNIVLGEYLANINFSSRKIVKPFALNLLRKIAVRLLNR